MMHDLAALFGRTHATDAEPLTDPGRHFVVTGCSHTQGVGLDAFFRYGNVISRQLKIPVYNLSRGGGNAWLCNLYAVKWLLTVGRPEFLVAQWPHPIRRMIFKNGSWGVYNVHSGNENALFDETLRWGEDNFWADWLSSVITTNAAYRAAGIPVVNMSLDPVPEPQCAMLKHYNIKIEDQGWTLDNQANDQLHHGRNAHAQWATKILEKLNGHTTR